MNPLKQAQLRALDSLSKLPPVKKKKPAPSVPAAPAANDAKVVSKPAPPVSSSPEPSPSPHPPPSVANRKPAISVAASPPLPRTPMSPSIVPGSGVVSVANMQLAPPPKSVGFKMKKVMEYLYDIGREASPDEILQNTSFDPRESVDPELYQALIRNPKIRYEDGFFSYQSKFNVKNREDLLEVLKQNPDGIRYEDLKDSYKGVEEDIKALRQDRRVIVIRNVDNKSDVIYPNDMQFHTEVFPEFKQRWRETEVPDEASLEKAMLEANLTPTAQAKLERKAPVELQKVKKKIRRRPQKLINTHVKGINLAEDYEPDANEGTKK